MSIRDIIRSWAGGETGHEDDDEIVDDRPCNVTGHRWGEWRRDPFSPSGRGQTSLTGPGARVKITVGMHRYCKKCGKYDTKNREVGVVEVVNDRGIRIADPGDQ